MEVMMIVGIGTDIAEIARFRRPFERFGKAFLEKIFSSEELAVMPKSSLPYLAGRFAAKEAAVKALGTGFSQGIGPRQIRVDHTDEGAPRLFFQGKALEQARRLGVAHSWISISHERNYAVAIVVLEGA